MGGLARRAGTKGGVRGHLLPPALLVTLCARCCACCVRLAAAPAAPAANPSRDDRMLGEPSLWAPGPAACPASFAAARHPLPKHRHRAWPCGGNRELDLRQHIGGAAGPPGKAPAAAGSSVLMLGVAVLRRHAQPAFWTTAADSVTPTAMMHHILPPSTPAPAPGKFALCFTPTAEATKCLPARREACVLAAHRPHGRHGAAGGPFQRPDDG